MAYYDSTGLDYVGDDDDDVGLDYVGDDDDVGARRRRAKKGLKIGALAKAGSLPQVFLGFDVTVNASTTGTATAEPNVHLRPTDLILRGSNAEDFLGTTLQVGRVNMIVGANGIPMAIFGPNQKRPVISSPMLQGGTNAQINLTNLTAANSRFLAALVCLDVSKHPASP